MSILTSYNLRFPSSFASCRIPHFVISPFGSSFSNFRVQKLFLIIFLNNISNIYTFVISAALKSIQCYSEHTTNIADCVVKVILMKTFKAIEKNRQTIEVFQSGFVLLFQQIFRGNVMQFTNPMKLFCYRVVRHWTKSALLLCVQRDWIKITKLL